MLNLQTPSNKFQEKLIFKRNQDRLHKILHSRRYSMKVNKLFAVALVAQFASLSVLAQDEMRRRGRQGGRNGQIIADVDALERRGQDERLDCQEFNNRGRRGRRDQTRQLQAQFCEYMSNKISLEDAWIDLEVAQEDLAGAERALRAEQENKRVATSDRAAAQRVITALNRSIPQLISQKQNAEASKASHQASINTINTNISAKQTEIQPLQSDYNQKLAAQNNYFNSTFKATKDQYDRVVSQRDNKNTQLRNNQNIVRTKTAELNAINRAIPGLNTAVGRAEGTFTTQITLTRRRIETGRYENQTGWNMLDRNARIMLEELKKIANSNQAANATTRRGRRGRIVRTATNNRNFYFRQRGRSEVEIYERFQTPAYRAARNVLKSSRQLDIDGDHIRKLEAKMVAIVQAEQAVADKEAEKVAAQSALDAANALVSSLPGEIATLNQRITSLTPNYNSQKSQFDGLVSTTNTAKTALDRANAQLASLRSNLATATRNLSQANADITRIAGEISAQQSQKAQAEVNKADAQARLDASDGLIQGKREAVTAKEQAIENLRDRSQNLIQELRDGSIVETYDRNLGVAATHIFVGAFPNALNFRPINDDDGDYRGRHRYRRRNFRNARYGNSIRSTYERAVRNGERIYLWGDLSDSYTISRISEETGVYGTYFPRRNRRGLVDIVVETQSSNRALVLDHDREQRLTFLDLDPELAVPVITAERIGRRGRVIDNNHVLMSASLKDTGAVVFTSGISISDMGTPRLQRILDKINSAPAADFEIARPDVPTGPALPGQVVNEASVTASGDNTIADRSNPVVEKALPISIGAGRIVKDIQVNIKMNYSYMGDISIKLKSPQGHVIILRDRAGRSAREMDATYTISTQDLTLTTSDNLDTRSTPGTRDISREYTAGQATDGQWSVVVEDVLPTHGDTGTLELIQLKVIAE